ncbi:helix-turn-helix transcriptional regulator, partial [Salmonella enterica]|nr:helix-turn-helix transcriptional regulator [Salmonella enterica]
MEGTVIRFMLNWVEQNIYTGANIGDLVVSSGYSRKTLEIWFYRNSGITLGDYLFRRRMSRVAILLRMTGLSVSELAAMFHFYSSQNLSRAFKTFSGMTPTKYRTQDEWFMEKLQRPFIIGWDNNLIPELCILPDLTLNGLPELYAHKFLSPTVDDKVIERMKGAIRLHRKNSDNEICIASRATPSSISDGRSDIVNIEMIIHDNNHENGDLHNVIIPAGEYMKFNFSGTWDEYIVFTRLIYFRLVELKKHRREGFDLTI